MAEDDKPKLTREHPGGSQRVGEEEKPQPGHDQHVHGAAKQAPAETLTISDDEHPAAGHLQPQRKRTRCGTWIRAHGRELDVVFNGVIAFFAVVVAVVGAIQTWATWAAFMSAEASNALTRESNAISRQTLEASSRAWVVPTGAPTDLTDAKNRWTVRPSEIRVAFRLKFKNFGASPAAPITISARSIVRPPLSAIPEIHDLTESSINGAWVEKSAMLAPGQDLEVKVVTPRTRPATTRKVFQHQLLVYAVGRVTYRDPLLPAVSPDRSTSFCFKWNWRENQFDFCPGPLNATQ